MSFLKCNGINIPAGLLMSLFFLPFALLAQSYPQEIQLEPALPEDGDTVLHHIFLGTADDSLKDVLSLQVVFALEGYHVQEGAEICFLDSSSWFADDLPYDWSCSLDSSRQEVTLTLTRSDGIARSGFGYLGSLSLVVTVEEVGKRALAAVRVKSVRFLFAQAGGERRQVQLYSLEGRLLRQGERLDLSGLPVGMYVVREKEGKARKIEVRY